MSNQNAQPLADWLQALFQKPQNTWTDYEAKVVAAYQLGQLQANRLANPPGEHGNKLLT